MRSRLQLDVHDLSRRRYLVNAYEVKAGIGVIAGKTVWSMPERLECEVVQKERYVTLTFSGRWFSSYSREKAVLTAMLSPLSSCTGCSQAS